MTSYIANREGATPVAGNVLLALTTGADEATTISEIAITGEATASAVNRMAVRRSTTNGTTPTAQTPARLSPIQQAAYTSVATTFTGSEPTTAAAPALWAYAINAFGALLRWIPGPGQGLFVLGNTAGNNEVSLESSSGTAVITAQIIFEEQ